MPSKRKKKQSTDPSQGNRVTKGGDRIAYAEFGAATRATERALPNVPPQQQDIRIQTTRKGKGGKTVTVLTGFQSNPDTLKTLLKKLKAQCGSGGTLKDQDIEIQGDHAETVLQHLTKLGYGAKISGGRR